MTSIVHSATSDNQTKGTRKFFLRNRAVEAVEASEVAEAAKVNKAPEVSKAWKITTEDFKVIQVLEFNNMRTYFDVLEKIFIDRIMKNPVEF